MFFIQLVLKMNTMGWNCPSPLAGLSNSRPAGWIGPTGCLELARGVTLETENDQPAVPPLAKTELGGPWVAPFFWQSCRKPSQPKIELGSPFSLAEHLGH
uniref:Uncharacterized protein n=1 Tax=Micrurus corallinus TaxID=54390 RepID=A0A2D4G6F0_MICCO